VPLDELGPPISDEALVRLDLPEVVYGDGELGATVLYIDRYGNTALNLTRDDLERANVQPGTRIELDVGGERYFAVAARTFADARAGDIVLFEDSYRNVAVAINQGSAAQMLGLTANQELVLRVP
jgi:hypothetical protein